jgi:hypothetical protein
MPRAGFERAISTFERPKTVLASDHSAIERNLRLCLENIRKRGSSENYSQNNHCLYNYWFIISGDFLYARVDVTKCRRCWLPKVTDSLHIMNAEKNLGNGEFYCVTMERIDRVHESWKWRVLLYYHGTNWSCPWVLEIESFIVLQWKEVVVSMPHRHSQINGGVYIQI